ncbi:capsule polysaccharide modification protein lipA [Vibrio ishigakensis]|uniref:Capsule polysaccharide modification protein lipA n=1 Tax=Vibrio ishigakensis TaxID=1481914 RepID=A0A0B8NZS3_9VIBR|nr:hypothetical protein [Vibrio ishigakensis]GAM56244.1 capsule polysaccharide modification protein lipA [Vibrio ishigakensis]
MFKHFDDVKVIVYLRRQDRQLVSHIQEGSKAPTLPAYLYYSEGIFEENNYDELFYLDYHKRLSLWANAIGKNNLVIRLFERNSLKNGDAVCDFFDLLGISIPKETRRSNESLSRNSFEIGLILNKYFCHRHHTSKLIRNLFKHHNASGQKYLPSRSTAYSIYSSFSDSNIELMNAFGDDLKFDEDFTMYSEQNKKFTLGKESIDLIFSTLANNQILSSDKLRDAAISLEQVNLEQSRLLMSAALKLKPHGKTIQSKLKKYEKLLKDGN